jgi:hypothetical protein
VNRPLRYILDGHEPKPMAEDDPDYYVRDLCVTIAENWFGHEAIGEIYVSTIFLGIDHARRGPPLLFETMIFAEGIEGLDGYQVRCCTWDEAMAEHALAIEHVKNAFAELAKASGA